MADDDGSQRPPQTYTTISPAGVGSSTINCLSPGTTQEILDTGDQSLIDQAWDQLTVEDMTRYLQSLPSPPGVGAAVFPAGVGIPASKPLLQEHEPPLVLAFLLMSFIERVLAFLQEHVPRIGAVPDCPQAEEPVPRVVGLNGDEDEVVPAVLSRPPSCLGHYPVPINK